MRIVALGGLAAACLFFLMCSGAEAYDTYVIHPKLSHHIAELYNTRNLERPLDSSQVEWLAAGSSREDVPAVRALNHFFNPVSGQGLTIAGLQVGEGSPEWAHSSLRQSLVPKSGDCSWQRALREYQQAGSGQDTAERSFGCLGQVLHLLEDASVPAHTRDDPHMEGDPFEQWLKYHNPEIEGTDTSVSLPECTTDQDCIRDLARWINMNFLSKDTMSAAPLRLPFGEAHIEGGYLLSWDGRKLAAYNPKRKNFILSEEILALYWQEIAPVMVAYGERLLEIFIAEAAAAPVPEPLDLQTSLEEKISALVPKPIKPLLSKLSGDRLKDAKPSIPISQLPPGSGKVMLPPINPPSIGSVSRTPLSVQEAEKLLGTTAALDNSASGSSNAGMPPVRGNEPLNYSGGAAAPVTPLPETYITLQPAPVTKERSARFVFASDQPEAGFQCSSLGNEWRSCEEEYTIDNLPDGDHELRVRAIVLGRPDPSPASYYWTVDSRPPITLLTANTADNRREAVFQFFSEAGSAFSCRLDEGDWEECISPREYRELASGTHVFRVRAVDEAGNEEIYAVINEWNIDMPRPLRPYVEFPAATPYYTNNPALLISGTVSDGTHAVIDGSMEGITQSGGAWSSERVLEAPRTVFSITAVNSYHESSDPYELEVYYDTVWPTASIRDMAESYPQSGFKVVWRGFDDNGLLRYDVEFKKGEGEWRTLAAGTAETEKMFDEPASWGEALSFRVRATDWAGNIGEWSEVVSTVLNPEPPHDLLISQLMPRGARGSLDEFVELYNPTAQPIYLEHYSLQTKRAAGTEWRPVMYDGFAATAYVPAHGYYLVRGHDYNRDEVADEVSTAEVAEDANGHIRLLDGNGQEIDKLGYGYVIDAEGEPALPVFAGQSLERKAVFSSTATSIRSEEGNGFDSNNNRFDFFIQVLPRPRGSHYQTWAGVLSEGLALLWHFDECSGETAETLGGARYAQPAEWMVGKFGCGIHQTWPVATHLRWTFPSAVEVSEMTLSFYVKDAHDANGRLWLVDKDGVFRAGISPSPEDTRVGHNGNYFSLHTSIPAPSGWYLSTVVYSANYVAWYVDGRLIKKIAGDYRVTNALKGLVLEQASWPWEIDEIAVWSRALSEQEVQKVVDGGQLPPRTNRPVQTAARLLHEWSFNESSGPAIDAQAGVAIPNAFRTPGWQGSGIYLSWQGQYQIDVPIPEAYGPDFSLAFWRRNGPLGGGGNGVTALVNSTTRQVFGVAGGFDQSYYFHNKAEAALGFLVPRDEAWHHIALVYDSYSYQIKYYVDGQEKISHPGMWLQVPFDRLVINEQQAVFSLDELKIWNGALSAAEVQELAQSVPYID